MMETFSDIPRLYTGLAEWLACMVYLSCMRKNGGGLWQVVEAAGFLLVQCTFLIVTDDVPVFLWIPCMAVAVGFMFLFLYGNGGCSGATAGYYTVRAFILAEFVASLEWQLYYYCVWQTGFGRPVVQHLFLAGFYGAAFGVMYWLERRGRRENEVIEINRKELLSAGFIGLAAFLMSNISYAYSNTPFSGQLVSDIFNTRTLMDLGGLAILYAYHVQRRELHVRHELEAINNILNNQYQQYQLSKESIEIVNRKYHDLKHLIQALRVENDSGKRLEWLDEMEADIGQYEAANKTGNYVLDTVLTGKSLYCLKNGITLTCVADGSLLHFMDTMDICTIFGNALDNAVECETRIEEKEKRLIHVTVSAKKEFLLIKFENYCEDAPDFVDGVPVTTKSDREFHGYGIKSIRCAAEKYGGTVSIGMEQNWFELRILIPALAARGKGLQGDL